MTFGNFFQTYGGKHSSNVQTEIYPRNVIQLENTKTH